MNTKTKYTTEHRQHVLAIICEQANMSSKFFSEDDLQEHCATMTAEEAKAIHDRDLNYSDRELARMLDMLDSASHNDREDEEMTYFRALDIEARNAFMD